MTFAAQRSGRVCTEKAGEHLIEHVEWNGVAPIQHGYPDLIGPRFKGDANGDRDAAIIFGTFFLVLIAFPYIPGLNQIPDKLKVYKLIWREKK